MKIFGYSRHGSGRDNDCAARHSCFFIKLAKRNLEITHKTGDVFHFTVHVQNDVVIILNTFNQCVEKSINFIVFQSGMQIEAVTSQLIRPFDQVCFESLISKGKGRGHAADAAADH